VLSRRLALFDRVSTKVRDTQMPLKQNISKIGESECSFTVTQDDKVECVGCHKIYNITYTVINPMKTHLRSKHRIDENTARRHQKWIERSNDIILKHIILNDDTITCRHCFQVFPRNFFSLMKHLITHKVDVPLEFK